ncbi:MAG: ATP-dependent 6-phosphofructokinase [Rhodospirillaceae bacterium]|nr:ATP-dependent 6-phosphofructokinase [Rhodospirillaceae bacterium]MBT4488034.1 ATP-dependent 6-phosphofructokinase [Rhodospirillaceae bacterium]MBT5194154.1 ATP-dependent 6-phosphofructokinase [Rhodospirillaceae bacterium]MBT5897720.1 ATP-dependent 6-phosphofructokinase [Rhodospirillaceae bacterium]MBT6427399.1 ATP-dependent 6-phosphofructokinase [Rhodospirillaceae bacterium]
MRLAILTGGGDVPGLNSCIKAVVIRAAENGWDMVGFRRGWGGPLHYNPDDDGPQDRWLQQLSPEVVRTIDRTGGTFLHTSRTHPGKVSQKDLPDFLIGSKHAVQMGDLFDCTPHVMAVFEALGIDALIAIGGDDTLSYAAHLHEQGLKVVAIPKTMDNDVYGTDYCIGFSTAISRSVEAITALRTPTGSHERIAVVELFGRNSGQTALISGYLADADRTLISEVPVDMDRLAALVMEDRNRNPSHYAMVVLSEGASIEGGDIIEAGEADAYGHLKLGGIGQHMGDVLTKKTGVATINQSLAYMMRAGPPDSLDRMVATNFANLAMQQLEDGNSGVMMALRDGNYTTVAANTCVQGEKRVDVDELYDSATYRPHVRYALNKPMFLY